jgi:hypothetical protein
MHNRFVNRREGLLRREREISEFEDERPNAAVAEKLLRRHEVDEPLFKGDLDASMVQRIGALVFGAFFILAGVTFAMLSFEKHNWIIGIPSIASFLLGGRMVQMRLNASVLRCLPVDPERVTPNSDITSA